MYALKSVGAVLLFFACTFMGFSAGQKEKERYRECEAFLSVFTYIENQITCFLAPTKRIYESLQNEVLEKTGFLRELTSHKEDDIYFDVWETALTACKENMHLTPYELDIVYHFGACIGKSNEDLQIRNLQYYKNLMAEEVRTRKEEMKKNIKVYRTLGMAVGLLIVILFL